MFNRSNSEGSSKWLPFLVATRREAPRAHLVGIDFWVRFDQAKGTSCRA
jgi:hypothetical protein